MRHDAAGVRRYGRRVPELWFLFGLVIGTVIAGFSAIGSFERGANSVRTAPWRAELRRRAVAAHRAPAHDAAKRRIEQKTSIAV